MSRPSAWTPDISRHLNIDFTQWRVVFWVCVWLFIASAVAAGVLLAGVIQ